MPRPLLLAMTLATLALPLCVPLARADHLKVPSAQFPTIQSAADAATNGDVIVIAKGVYDEAVTMTGKTGVTIRAKKGAIIDNEHTDIGLEMNGCGIIVVRGLTVRDGTGSGIFLGGCADIVITRCNVLNTGGDAITLANCGNVRIVRNRIEQGFVGVNADAQGVVIRDNRISNVVTTAVQIIGNGFAIEGNRIAGVASLHGLTIGNGDPASAASVMITRNSIRNIADGLAGDGIHLNGVAQCTVLANRISKTSGHGVNIVSGAALTIQSNRITKPGVDGMHGSAQKVQYLSNVVRNAAGSGIVLDSTSDQSLLFGNSVKGCAEYGLDVDSDFNEILENTATGSGLFDLRNQGMLNTLVDNVFGTVAT